MNLGNVYLKGATLLALVLSGLRDAGMVRWGGGLASNFDLSLSRKNPAEFGYGSYDRFGERFQGKGGLSCVDEPNIEAGWK